MWSLHPKYLDDARLMREHQSIHRLLNAVLCRDTDRRVAEFTRYGGYLAWRHWLAVNEMRMRGKNHNSFIDGWWRQVPDSRRMILYRYPRSAVIQDYGRLRQRHHRARHAVSCGGGQPIPEDFPDDLAPLALAVSKTGLPVDCFLV